MNYRNQGKIIKQNSFIFGVNKIKRIYRVHLFTLIMVIPFCIKMYFLDQTYSLTNFVFSSLTNLFLIQSWVPDESYYFSLNGVSWYLSTALFLYISFPSIKRVLDNSKIRKIPNIIKLIVVIVISTLINWGFSFTVESFSIWGRYICPLTRIFDFIIGCILGEILFDVNDRNNSDNLVKINVGGIIILALDVMSLGIYSNIVNNNQIVPWWGSTVMWYIPSLLTIFYVYKQKGWFCNILSGRILVHLGDISPYLYLFHQVFIRYFQAIEKYILCGYRYSNIFVCVASAFFSVISSELLYRLVQRKKF